MDTTPNTVAAAHREPNALYETPGIDLFGTNENGEADTNHLEWIDYDGTHEQWEEQNPTRAAEEMLAERGYRVTGEWTDCGEYFTADIEAL